MEKNIPVAQREHYIPSRFTECMWWLSTAEKELITDAVIDRNRYKIIGMTVLATWLFATLAWSYFFSTVTHNIPAAILLGIFMGLIILTIDRALIKGINRYNKNKAWPLLLRGLLALTIGTFMAQPALLYMFRKEIQLQTTLDNEKKKISNNQVIDAAYNNRKSTLADRKKQLQSELDSKYATVNAARNAYIAEADGSGGTGKVGISTIALAKKKEYEKLQSEYDTLQLRLLPQLQQLDADSKKIDEAVAADQQLYAAGFNDGFLTQIEALNNLIKSNAALELRYYLLVAILLLIELMPVIAKTLLPSGTYDERVILREGLEKEMTASNIRREKELKELYNNMALESDKEAIRSFFAISKADKEEKIRSFSERWKNDQRQSFDGLWEKMKKEILTRQEN